MEDGAPPVVCKPKVAIVHDWLTNMGGAERLLLSMHKAFPDAPIYTSVFDAQACPDFKKLDIRTTWLQRLPRFMRYWHQLLPVLRAQAFRKLDLSEYDIIISSASAEAKAVRKQADAIHICYCHTPTRYYWSHYNEYLRNPGFGAINPLVRLLIPPFVALMRRLDLRAVAGVDFFIANSRAVAERIATYYKRESVVINPGINLQPFRKLNVAQKRRGFIIIGRQVAYKRNDLAVAACTRLGLPLELLGIGPEHARLKAMAGPTITFITGANDAQKANALAQAEGFIFPQQEDFGMVQIEAMAAGTPIIAYKAGGALDVVQSGKTGLFFAEQTIGLLCDALQRCRKTTFDHAYIRGQAEQFSEDHFIYALQQYIKSKTN